MNTGLAVLLALVLIVVVLLIVWLVLRSRSTSAGSSAPAPSVSDRVGMDPVPPARDGSGPDLPAGVGAAAVADPAPSDEVGDTGAAVLGSDGTSASDGADLAEEYVEPGLSDLRDPEDDRVAHEEGATSDGAETAQPRTPAEAFGEAHAVHGTADAGSADASVVRSETSVLDETDVDSTPLFRSIREERLGTLGTEDASRTEPDHAEPDYAEPDFAEPDRSWSGERRGWDEQAHEVDSETASGHAEDPTVAAQTADAIVESVGPTDEEDHEVPTDQESITSQDVPSDAVAAEDAAAPTFGEEPPMRRISELHEVVDGGFGIGSAAPIADGAQPLGHPIKANLDTKTYQDLHSPWYDSTEPDVWFLDAGFAERAGFHRAE
jgi:hypothetical protein